MQKANFTEERKAIADCIKELRTQSGYTSYETFAIENGHPAKTIGVLKLGKTLR